MMPSPPIFVNRALETVNTFGQDLEKPIHDPVPCLRVEFGGQLHRAFHVGEEHSDLFALTLEGAARCEDLFG
jgi:hypothetical protein